MERCDGENYRAAVAGYNRPDVARTSDKLFATSSRKAEVIGKIAAKRYRGCSYCGPVTCFRFVEPTAIAQWVE